MSEDIGKKVREIIGELRGDPLTPDQRIDDLERQLEYERANRKEDRDAQSDTLMVLSKRVTRLERINNYLIGCLGMAAGYVAVKSAIDYWEGGDGWNALSVIGLLLLFYLPLRDILRTE